MENKHVSSPKGSTSDFIQVTSNGQEPTIIKVPSGKQYYRIEPKHASEHYIFYLQYPETEVFIRGIVKAAGESTPFLKTEVIHEAPHTRAESLIRTLSTDHAAPRYEGLIRISKTAEYSESFLNHHSLLLGDSTKSWTLPSLEILANQVKCSHAATIKTITESDLFYARSRGISKIEATELLVEAFLADAVKG